MTEGVSYTYDTRGNILSKTTTDMDGVETTINYAYTDSIWADRLTDFDGTAITYDEIGNPLNWTNNATLTWQHGRQLASYTKDGRTVSYMYNQDGIRTLKTVNGIDYRYTVIDGTLRRLTVGNNTLEFVGGTSVIFNGTEYWYVFNAQNDVIGIIDANGTYVVEYTYDAWGKILSKTGTMASTLGYLNPFRYRGYIYDEETGWYYLQTRYYDPVVGRFLNADGVIGSNRAISADYNIYLYCANSPINKHDSTGYEWVYNGKLYYYDGTASDFRRLEHGLPPASYEKAMKNDPLKSFRMVNGDGYALDDSRRWEPDGPFHSQIVTFSFDEPSWSPTDGYGASVSAKAISGGWEWENVDLSLLDIGTAQLSASFNDGVNLSAMASIYEPSITFDFFGLDVTLGANIGSIGAKARWDKNGVEFGLASVFGFNISIS